MRPSALVAVEHDAEALGSVEAELQDRY